VVHSCADKNLSYCVADVVKAQPNLNALFIRERSKLTLDNFFIVQTNNIGLTKRECHFQG